MRYTSDAIQRIVTSESALLALERISPIYGDAENFLHLLQAIGSQIDLLVGYGRELQNEAIPQTTNRLISYWEMAYGIAPDDKVSIEKRREKLMAKIRSKPPMNKYKMEALASAAAGVKATIRENVAKNTFAVDLYARDASELIMGEDAVRDVINRVKPAHIIYNIVYSQPLDTTLYVGGVVRTLKFANLQEADDTMATLGLAMLGVMRLGE